jgi:large subunit ribosomal protein L10
MSKYVKGLVQSEFEKRLAGVDSFLVINTTGVGGITNNQLRGELRKKGVKLMVVKNTLAKKILEKRGIGAAAALLSGPCTFAFGGDSVVDVAKEFTEITKKFKMVEVKGACVDGLPLDAKGAIELAKMPNRAQLQAQVVMLFRSPGAKVAAAIISPASKIAGCIKTIIEKAEKGQEAEKAA